MASRRIDGALAGLGTPFPSILECAHPCGAFGRQARRLNPSNRPSRRHSKILERFLKLRPIAPPNTENAIGENAHRFVRAAHSYDNQKTSMRKNSILTLIAAGAAYLLVSQASAQVLDPWQTVYEGSQTTPPSTRINDLAADTSGAIVALETVYDPTVGAQDTALVMSADAGVSWVRRPVILGRFDDVTLASSGDLFLSGSQGVIMQSSDAGITWHTAWTTPGGGLDGDNAIHDLAAGSGGAVYAAAEIKPRWLLVKAVPEVGGMSWAIVDDYHPDSKTVYQHSSIAVRRGAGVGGADEIYVGGFQNHQRNGGSFLVRKSYDGGATWTTVMAYQIVAGAYMAVGVQQVAIAPDGTVYVAGRLPVSKTRTGKTTTLNHASLLRKSTDGGLTWTSLLQTPKHIQGLTVDLAGRVFLGLWDSQTANSTVEVSADEGVSWSVSDTTASTLDVPRLAVDSAGNVYSGGSVYQGGSDNTYSAYSVIRTLAAP